MILSAQTIRRLCLNPMGPKYQPLLVPFHERTVHAGMTFGLGPAGYDIRIREDMELSAGHELRLASSLERFALPDDVLGFVCDKSTWVRRGLTVQNTVLEPGWEGYLTLELVNHGGRITLQAGMPIAQVVFCRLDDPTEQPYRGKYQDQQPEPTPAKEER